MQRERDKAARAQTKELKKLNPKEAKTTDRPDIENVSGRDGERR